MRSGIVLSVGDFGINYLCDVVAAAMKNTEFLSE